MTDLRLAGRVALVTGGAKGVGRAISLELAREGAAVAVLAGHDLAAAEATAAEIIAAGGQALPLALDITSKTEVEATVAAVVARFGKIDICVNNAGAGARGALVELSEDDWDKVFNANAKGTFLVSTAVARAMLKDHVAGSIITIAGASAHRSYPFNGGYGPAKAAVVSLTQQMALEWGEHGIRVNGVSPGPIRDPGTGWEEREPALAAEVAQIPLGRAGATTEIAKVVAFLASDDAGYITGQMIIADGGSTATWYLYKRGARGRWG